MLFLETIDGMNTPRKNKDQPSATIGNESTNTGNHLGVPKPTDNNPNLLSPEILNQRRGELFLLLYLFQLLLVYSF